MSISSVVVLEREEERKLTCLRRRVAKNLASEGSRKERFQKSLQQAIKNK
jgi:hypothetical protein